jgi:ribosomal-protein-alanine N-acetyltransferase
VEAAVPTPDEVVRLAPADCAQLAEIEALVFPEPQSLAQIERLCALPSTCYLGVRAEGRLLAFFGFEVLGPTAHVIANATRPEARRRGLARRVLQAGEPMAAARGARWFLGEVRASNAAQRRLLRLLGWREVGVAPKFFGNGEDAVVVWRLLPRAGGDTDAPAS